MAPTLLQITTKLRYYLTRLVSVGQREVSLRNVSVFPLFPFFFVVSFLGTVSVMIRSCSSDAEPDGCEV